NACERGYRMAQTAHARFRTAPSPYSPIPPARAAPAHRGSGQRCCVTRGDRLEWHAFRPPSTETLPMLEKLFQLKAHGTNVRTEILAGVTTFLTMAYIIFVNPMMMADSGIDPGAAFVATCLAAALGSLIMGAWANYPIALAPGMGLNAFFSYTVVGSMGYSWQVALGAVFISGFLFFMLSIFRIREWIINSIPMPL